MTLCIAATCVNDITADQMNQAAIVICADAMVTAGGSSSETGFKREEIGPYVALYSGCISEAYELLSAYRDYLATNPLRDPLSGAERLTQLRQPLEDHKRRKLDHLVRMRIGISHADFLQLGDQVDPEIRALLRAEIWALSVGVDLLFASFAPGATTVQESFDRAFIFRLREGDIEVHKNFACIGEGALAAEQSLHRREQSDLTLLSKTLYHVYEAKKMGELARSVGEQTMLAVMEPDNNGEIPWLIRPLTPAAKDYLDDCFRRYGPQRVGQDAISFPADPFIDMRQRWSLVPPPVDPPDSTASE
jgi:hypothetical protein